MGDVKNGGETCRVVLYKASLKDLNVRDRIVRSV